MSTLKNKVNLIGRVGAKPEELVFNSGSRKVRIPVAINERYKDKKGEWVDNTQWHNVIAWGNQVDRVLRMLDKGSEVVIEGKLINRSFEAKTGETRYVTEVELTDFLPVGKRIEEKVA